MEKDFILLKCPQCGGKLKASDDVDIFGCIHCKGEVLLRAPRPRKEVASKIDREDAEAERALARYQEELASLKQELANIRQVKTSRVMRGVMEGAVVFGALLLWGWIFGGGWLWSGAFGFVVLWFSIWIWDVSQRDSRVPVVLRRIGQLENAIARNLGIR